MKKPYQIESQRAVKQLEAMAADGNPAVQMVLPMAEMVGWLRQGVGELIRQAGLRLMDLLMQEEVRELVGERSQRQAERTANRWVTEAGYCMSDGAESSGRAAARAQHRRPGSAFGQLRAIPPGRTHDETVWEKLMLGLSHEEIRSGRARVHRSVWLGEERRQRTFHRGQPGEVTGDDGAAAGQDAAVRAAHRRHAVRRAATGSSNGNQPGRGGNDSGLRQNTENATVVGELLSDLVSRGLDFTEPILYILDGGKALTAALKKHAGESAAIQRCQVHKRRNVLDHLTDEQRPALAKKLNAAYALEDHAAAKQALNSLHRELMDLNPSAARSLGEGMEETLTVHRLHVPMQLRKTLASTNVIESAFSIVEQVCKNVKRWHGGDQRERWVGSGTLEFAPKNSSARSPDINRFRCS